jgi:hypothetical protein
MVYQVGNKIKKPILAFFDGMTASPLKDWQSFAEMMWARGNEK